LWIIFTKEDKFFEEYFTNDLDDKDVPKET